MGVANNRNHRASCMNLCLPFGRSAQIGDGTIDRSDRAFLGLSYAGLAKGIASIGGGINKWIFFWGDE